MKNFRHQKSRQLFPDRFPSEGSLPYRRSLSFVVYSLLVLLPAFLVANCGKEPAGGGGTDIPEEERRDSAVTLISFAHSDRPVERLDVFIYETEGIQKLEKHIRLDSLPESMEVYASKGDKLIAAIANSPKQFNLTALSRYSAVSQISYDFSDDSPEMPIMSGSAKSSGQQAGIELAPMLCKVVLGTIANTMDDYELLEEPRIRLRGLNAAAKFFNTEKHLPGETIDKGVWVSLPYDIGYYPQEPGTELYCYPNETAESVIGQDRTALELECGIKGRRYSFTVDLPPFGRASSMEVEISVDGPGAFSSSVR